MQDHKSNALKLMSKLKQNGFEAYIAGGAVRDYISGDPVSDYDIVTNARPDIIKDIFRKEKAYIAGKAFLVCYIGSIEVATYRDIDGHFSDNLEEDLRRRDLTINSMAMDLQNESIIDLYNGKKDLKEKVIRFTESPDNRILEDPLRIIRSCRFLAKYQGRFSVSSLSSIKKHRHLVKDMAPERIKTEILKAMKIDTPSLFFEILHTLQILRYFLPSMDRLAGLDGGPHHDETVFEHALLAGNSMPSQKPLLRLTSYLHDTGKKDACKLINEKPVFHGHETETGPLESDLKRLKFSNVERDFILNHIHMHMRSLNHETTPKSVRKILADLSARNLTWHDFLLLKTADRKGNSKKQPYRFSELKIKVQKIKDEIEKNTTPALSIKDLDISGTDLIREFHIKEGPDIGMTLSYLFDMILEDPELNKRERLLDLAAEYIDS